MFVNRNQPFQTCVIASRWEARVCDHVQKYLFAQKTVARNVTRNEFAMHLPMRRQDYTSNTDARGPLTDEKSIQIHGSLRIRRRR
jgi:hypothetical protein